MGLSITTISATLTLARSSTNANGRRRSTVPSRDLCGRRGRAPVASGTVPAGVDDDTPSTQVGSSLRRTVGTCRRSGTPPRSRRRVFALRRPKGRPGGADAADGRAPRHRRRRAPMAPPGPGGDVRVDAQQGRHDRPRRRSGALDRSAAFFSRGTSGQWRDLLDDACLARTPRACGRSRPATSSSGCIASRSTEIPVRRYTRTTQADRQRRPPPVTADPRSGPTLGVCASTDAGFGVRCASEMIDKLDFTIARFG